MVPAKENSSETFEWEKVLYRYKTPISVIFIGLIMIGVAFLFYQQDRKKDDEITVIESEEVISNEKIVIEITGAVESPGVYDFEANSRIEDALIKAGGLSAEADREWVEKTINRAAKLVDGQKVYIASVNEQTDVLSAKDDGGYQTTSGGNTTNISGKININTASQKELESLWGIGPVYAQKVIEQRPYSNTEELLSRKVIKTNVYERIKDQISVY